MTIRIFIAALLYLTFASQWACGDPPAEDPAMGEWYRTWPGRNEATAERWFRLDADDMGSHSHRDGGLLEGELSWERNQDEYTLNLYCGTIDGEREPCIGVPSSTLKCRHDSSADTLTCENAEA